MVAFTPGLPLAPVPSPNQTSEPNLAGCYKQGGFCIGV